MVTSSLPVGIGFTDFVSVDDDVVTTEMMSDDDIIESLSYEPNPELEEEEDDSVPVPPLPTATDAKIALAVIRHFFEAQQDSYEDLRMINELEGKILSFVMKSMRQTKITDFFSY